MSKRFAEYKELNLPSINLEILKKWEIEHTFEKSITEREGHKPFVFYEGPPSANGMPGIHHAISRTIKDIFCRYKSQQGFQVERKAGWDTHGLPVELGVEKMLGITKEAIGKSVSVEEYNATCRREVMKYTDAWEELTHKMGYWVDMKKPYITYETKYIETLWWLIKELYNKGLLYKGYTIQPYSPAAGTGLSTHELNQPGCYRDVKDTTCVAQFEVDKNAKSAWLFEKSEGNLYILAWTTTPWTLPSNTALAVGAQIEYCLVKTLNPYSGNKISVVIAKERIGSYFNSDVENMPFDSYKSGDKKIPYVVVDTFWGNRLESVVYKQLIPWVKPMGDAFRVICGDFVTTEDGTGVVHIAPTFGADDDRVAKKSGISPLILIDADGKRQPMVDRTGKFYRIEDLDTTFVGNHVDTNLYSEYAGRYVKNAYDASKTESDTTLDVDLCVMLKKEDKAFKIEKHIHNYPHCWRTDKPVLYYPLDSWFIKTTAMRDRMIELNKTINWKPESTGTGRFGKWLENLMDWNLSRSRFWGTPLPIWRTEDGSEIKCIGSVSELFHEIEKSKAAGLTLENPFDGFILDDLSDTNYNTIDLHRNIVDKLVLLSDSGKPMYRENDLIDVWFDSGAMPYAQLHYPFENKEIFDQRFPADFIAEGVDQTRGWFFTLHALATMLFDSVAFKNIISNGLVLDKAGNKMSKRLGNAVDPFEVFDKSGADPLRWYLITNAQPWDNIKFDPEGLEEVKRKFFGTLYNTYSFFALYANVDGFNYSDEEVPMAERQEIDRWVISLLNSLVKDVTWCYENYEPTRAARAIQDFVGDNLSNWYVRLNRKRFWGGSYNKDKIAAYQTLYTCLSTVAQLMAPVAPFFSDKLFCDLNNTTGKSDASSVHLELFPVCNEILIDSELENRMTIAQTMSSMILALRRKVNIRVRQPLSRIMVPLVDPMFKERFEKVQDLVLNEVNVKSVEFLTDTSGILVKKIKPNFKTLGPKFGKYMKQISAAVAKLNQQDIALIEKNSGGKLDLGEVVIDFDINDVEIISEDIPGWLVANEGKYTVALDIVITDELKLEGIAREFVNRIQNLRKDAGFDVTDKIVLYISTHQFTQKALEVFGSYIQTQTLATKLINCDFGKMTNFTEVEIEEGVVVGIRLEKC